MSRSRPLDGAVPRRPWGEGRNDSRVVFRILLSGDGKSRMLVRLASFARAANGSAFGLPRGNLDRPPHGAAGNVRLKTAPFF